MDKKSIKEKEYNRNKEFKYSHIINDSPTEYIGETIDQFLARGGSIKKIETKSKNKKLMELPK